MHHFLTGSPPLHSFPHMCHSLISLVLLYNILLPINHYIGSIPINAIIKGFPMVISSDLWVIASAPSIASDLLNISNPHEYVDTCY